jgi:hypothetical protein
MFEFFIALFGILFYGAKYSSERHFIKQDNFNSEWRCNWMAIKVERLGYPFEELEKLKRDIRRNPDPYIEEVSDALLDAFGEDYGAKLIEHYRYGYVLWLTQLVLAKRGYIDPQVARYGYTCGKAGGLGHKQRLTMCRYIESYLRQNGEDDMRLMTSGGDRGEYQLQWIAPSIAEHSASYGGLKYKSPW